jgi:subtilisin family serine protease
MLSLFISCIAPLAYGAELLKAANPIDKSYIIVLDNFDDGLAKSVESSLDYQHKLLDEHLNHMFSLTSDLPLLRTADGHYSAFTVKDTYESIPGFNGYSAMLSEQALWMVLNDPLVASVEEDAVMETTRFDYSDYAAHYANYADFGAYSREVNAASKNSCSRQTRAVWNLPAINHGRATTSSTSFLTPSHGGQGVDIYIFDTGVRRSHQDFGGRASWGFDAFTSSPHRTDRNGHGTHVGSSAAGRVYGVAKRANIIDVRVLGDDGRGSSSGYIAGVDYAVARTRRHGRTSIMNASLGFASGSSSVDRATTSATQYMLVVVASGNDSMESCNVSPARASGVLSVGNAQRDNSRRPSSNWGTCTHIYGPGSSIVAASHSSDSRTTSMTGTSMASPHVAGVAALYLADNPSLSPSQLRRRVIDTAQSGSVSDARGTNLYARYRRCD